MALNRMLAVVVLGSILVHVEATAAREWKDAAGNYALEADLISKNDKTVVLKRADHELVALPIESLSEGDREYLKSAAADASVDKIMDGAQTWKLRDGGKLVGRIVDYCDRDVTIQRRRGHVYVNDQRFNNLPESYQQLIPAFVAHYEKLENPDRRSFDAWVLRQRGQPRTLRLQGVVLELENGNEYSVPFFLFSDEDRRVLGEGWDEWQAAHRQEGQEEREDVSFLLQSLAAARYHDQQVMREIALMNLKLQAVQAGLTSLWEVTLYPLAGFWGPPRWVVVPGRSSDQAAANALAEWPGYAVGPIRRVSRR